MTRLTYPMLILLPALFVAGCSTDYDVAAGYDRKATDSSAEEAAAPASGPGGEAAPLSPAEGPGVEQSARPPAAPSPSGPAPEMVLPPSAAPSRPVKSPPSRPTPSQPSASQRASIKLSALVALPQSLPTGTAMGFSVDYVVVWGRPGTSPYTWVIKPSRGQTVRQPVQLKQYGTLQGFVLQFRPEHGPFDTHIEDADGNRLSPSLRFP